MFSRKEENRRYSGQRHKDQCLMSRFSDAAEEHLGYDSQSKCAQTAHLRPDKVDYAGVCASPQAILSA